MTNGKAGTTVRAVGPGADTSVLSGDRSQALAFAATEYASQVHRFGFDVEQAIAALRAMTSQPRQSG